MKKLIYITFVSLVLSSCAKENATSEVRYEVSRAYAETELTYRNSEGGVVTEWVAFESGEDVWVKEVQMKLGEIVYLSAMYLDSASSVKIRILIDGKTYKEGSSNNEPDKYLVVSGTVPFN